MSPNKDLKEFTVQELSQATGGWHPLCLIGEGGFGRVYRAMVRCTPVAIKVMDQSGLQGLEEFNNEMALLSTLAHPHLVRLIGYCTQGSTRCLVYELMSRGNLDEMLACKDGAEPLPWASRVRIAAQVSAALQYLHTRLGGSIIHRDIKPANIFLDSDLNAKLGDIGLATVMPHGNTITHSRGTDVIGDWSYLAPEYKDEGRHSLKTDVYAFGLSVLQLLTGQASCQGLLKRCMQALEEHNLAQVLDPLAGQWEVRLAERIMKLAVWCSLDRATDRPAIEVVAAELGRLVRQLPGN